MRGKSPRSKDDREGNWKEKYANYLLIIELINVWTVNKTNEMVWREKKRKFEKENDWKKEIRGIQNNSENIEWKGAYCETLFLKIDFF
jgi:elongation factor P--beta-lysine ligase